MKKLLLMSAFGAFGALSASAQLATQHAKLKVERVAELPATSIQTPSKSTAKVTAAGYRSYSHADYIEAISTATMNSWSTPIWQDTTIRQNFTSGLGTINYSSVSQIIFPFDNFWNDPLNPNFNGKIKVTKTNTYNVDSVSILGLYVQGNSPGSSAKPDSLLISVASQPAGAKWIPRGSTSSWALPYLPSGKDTFYGVSPFVVDSAKRFVMSSPTTTAKVTWTVALSAAQRKRIDTATVYSEFSYKLPSSLTVPAGNVVVVSYTFKSGDSWVKNVDTITQHHHFRAAFGYLGTSTAADKQLYNWYGGDHNMSGMMFSTDTSDYWPTVYIGAWNTPASFFNHYLLNTVTLSCASCALVTNTGINENTLVSSVNAYPNPSSETIAVELSVKEKANVTVSVSNMLGQVIATQNMGAMNAGQKTTATFNTSALAAGVYLYTVEADGQRVTNRFTVAH